MHKMTSPTTQPQPKRPKPCRFLEKVFTPKKETNQTAETGEGGAAPRLRWALGRRFEAARSGLPRHRGSSGCDGTTVGAGPLDAQSSNFGSFWSPVGS